MPFGGYAPSTPANNSMLSLPGETGDYASIPNNAAFTGLTDMVIAVRVALTDWTPTASQILCANYLTSSQGFRLYVHSAGTIRLERSVSGFGVLDTIASTVAPSVSDGDFIWVKVKHDGNNGAAGSDISFWTSTVENPADGDGDYTQLGTTVTDGNTCTFFNSTGGLEWGASNAGASFPSTGNWVRGKLWSSLTESPANLQVDANFNTQDIGATSFTEDSSNGFTVTVNQSGSPQAEIIAFAELATPFLFLGAAAYEFIGSVAFDFL